MTIEEAIEHCKEVALSNAACGVAYRKGGQTVLADSCDACAAEHEHLAEWLTELKQRREAEITAQPKTNADRIRQMSDEELADWITDGHDLCDLCQFSTCRPEFVCEQGVLEWLRKEADEDAGTDD